MVSQIAPTTPLTLHLPGHGRLEAEWLGPGPDQGPTLIFLHEGLGCTTLWRDVPARLAALTGCGALVYSRLGHGGSDPCPLPRPIDFMHHEGLQVLPEVLGQMGIGDHLLVGHSDGGSIALINAGGNPGTGLRGVVTLAAHVFCEEVTRRSIQAARQRYLDGDLKGRLRAYHGDNTDGAFWGWNDVWLHPDFRQWTIEAFLPAIGVPVLAIQGLADPYGTVAQTDAIQRHMDGRVSVMAVADCGHAPHLEKKDLILSAIQAFVATHLLPDA